MQDILFCLGIKSNFNMYKSLFYEPKLELKDADWYTIPETTKRRKQEKELRTAKRLKKEAKINKSLTSIKILS